MGYVLHRFTMAKISGLIALGSWMSVVAYRLITAFGQKATAEQQGLLSALAHRLPLVHSVYLLLS